MSKLSYLMEAKNVETLNDLIKNHRQSGNWKNGKMKKGIFKTQLMGEFTKFHQGSLRCVLMRGSQITRSRCFWKYLTLSNDEKGRARQKGQFVYIRT